MCTLQDTDDDEPQVARAVAELPEADQESQHTVKLKSGADVYFWAYARPAKTRVETLRFRFPGKASPASFHLGLCRK